MSFTCTVDRTATSNFNLSPSQSDQPYGPIFYDLISLRFKKSLLGFALVNRIRLMKLSEHEMALISCLSIFNPENLSPKLVSPADEKDLSLNKEIIFNILRILTREKYPKVHYRRLAAIVSIMSELQAFHMNNMTTWEKFLTFKVSSISPQNLELVTNISNLSATFVANTNLTII